MTAMPNEAPALEVPDLFRGGIYTSVMQRFGVETTTAVHAAKRAVGVALFLWAPAAILALIERHALPGCSLAVPFFAEPSTYTRSLLVVPLLMISKPILAASWRQAGARFRERGILVGEARVAAEALAARITRSAKSLIPHVVCLLLAIGATLNLVRLIEAEPNNSWFAQPTSDGKGSSLTLAGRWSAYVAHTVVFYLSLMWFWRMFLWYRFLFGVSRLPLTLLPMHPDRAAGLGFLGKTIAACAPLVLAWALALAAPAASLMIHGGHKLEDFSPLGIGLALFVLLLFVVPPTLIFAAKIVRARRDALEEWGRRMAHTGEGMRRTADGHEQPAEGLEDLQIAVTAVRSTLPFPFALSHLLPLLAAIGLPALGLVLLAIPFGEALDRLLKLL